MGEAAKQEKPVTIRVSKAAPRGLPGLAAQVRRWIRRRGGWFAFGVGVSVTAVASAFFVPSVSLYLQRRGWIDWGANASAAAVATVTAIAASWPFLIAVGVAAGIVLGRASAGRLSLDRQRARNEEEMEAALGLRVLGSIPRYIGPDPLIEHLGEGYSPIGESYEQLRSVLSDSLPGDRPVQIMVTGDLAQCGKSITALGLARSFSAAGNSVLLIDADLRSPSFRGPSSCSNGLAELLAGTGGFEDCSYPTVEDRLFLLPAGRIPTNAGQLLARFSGNRELNKLPSRFDIIVVDTGGMLSGAIEIARYCGWVLFVHSARNDLAAARRALRPFQAMAGVTVLGALTMAGNVRSWNYDVRRDTPEDQQREPRRQMELLRSD